METIRGFIARCAAVMGANGQVGFDALLPTVLGTGIVHRDTQGLIIAQIKNNESYSATVRPSLFDSMDPVSMGFLGANETLNTPVIRIVFALAASILRSPGRMAFVQRLGSLSRAVAGRKGSFRRLPPPLSAWTDTRDAPAPAAESFRAWWARTRGDEK